MAIYENKYVLSSNRYSGRTYMHDSVDECKAHYEALMIDEDFLSFDPNDVVFTIYPALVARPEE